MAIAEAISFAEAAGVGIRVVVTNRQASLG